MFSLFENYVDENGFELKRLGENVKEFQSLRWKIIGMSVQSHYLCKSYTDKQSSLEPGVHFLHRT